MSDTATRLDATIRRACARELRKMVDSGVGKINDWDPDALATWIAPGIIKSVKRAIAATKGE